MKDEYEQLRVEMRKLQAQMQTNLDALTDRVANNERGIALALSGAYNDILNLIDNSMPEWSKLAYTRISITASDAGDDNLEAFAWFRQRASDTVLDQIQANALKAAKTSEPADHSLWAANEGTDADIPIWDKVNSFIAMGGATELWDLFIAIPNDVMFPGQIFYVQFEAMLDDAADLPDGVQFYAGVYDSTAGEEHWLEGGTFTITDGNGHIPGVTQGIPGARSVNYKVIAFTDSGETAESNILNFPNAPAAFDADNHPVIKFSGVPGFNRFDIYREISGAYVLQFSVQNTFDLSYHDVGNPPVRTVTAFPSAITDRPRAYAITRHFAPGHDGGAGWVRHTLTIFIPITYDRSITDPGQQGFRLGLSAPVAHARQVRIRKIGLSMGNGKWARSPNDIRKDAHSAPSSTAAGSGSGGSGGIGPPPEGGGGGDDPPCPRVGQYVRILGEDGSRQAIRVELLTTDHMLWNPALQDFCKVRSATIVPKQAIWGCATTNGVAGYSSDRHPIIQTASDRKGLQIAVMEPGDLVMTEVEDLLIASQCEFAWPTGEVDSVVRIEMEGSWDEEKIYEYSDDPGKGWILCHNTKDGNVFLFGL